MYTIKEAAEKMNLPASTIRYYDKQGLLPFVQRSESGYRSLSNIIRIRFSAPWSP